MRTKTITLSLGLAALTLASCDAKDPVYKTDHPDHGRLTLTADFSQRGAGIDVPASYIVTIGDFSDRLYGETNEIEHLFTPGKYTAYVYNTPTDIHMDGTTASVSTVPAPADTDAEGAFVEASPEWLFTCSQDTVLYPDTDYRLRALMEQQVRQLTLIIEPTGGTTDRVERIEGYLSGVAGSFDIANGMHSTPSNVALTFTRIHEGADAGKWAATVRLLGTTDTPQKLTATLVFSDGGPAPVRLESDLSTGLAAFNADKPTPLTLGGRVVETHTPAGFTATITEWNPVQGGGVTAN